MPKVHKEITITWRDENYGSVSGSVAFRAWVEPFPSDTEHAKLARIYKKHGFEVNHTRAAWVAPAKDEGMPARFVEALEAFGYAVTSDGHVPASLVESNSPKI